MSLDRFVQVVSEVTGLAPEKLTDDKSLCRDLGIAGADGYDLLDKLSEEYGISWGDFDSIEWFGPEAGFNPLAYFRAVLDGDQVKQLERDRRFTLGHLRQVCERGEWFDPA